MSADIATEEQVRYGGLDNGEKKAPPVGGSGGADERISVGVDLRGSGQPTCATASLECVLLTGTRSAESIMASGPGAPHQQVGHMAAPTSPASPSKKTLANGEPSTHGTSRTNRVRQEMSTFGAKPDLRRTAWHVAV
jgi:hypothetical protein